MTDLLIRNLDAETQRSLELSARSNNRDISSEAKDLLRKSLGLPIEAAQDARSARPEGMGMGTWLQSLVPPEYRGDDLIVERRPDTRPPPDFD